MGVFETFSKRQRKRERAGEPDTYQYEALPQAFRVQVIHIWRTALGESSSYDWQDIHDRLAREMGVFTLSGERDPYRRCCKFLLETDMTGALDIIELTFRWIDRAVRRLEGWERSSKGITQVPDDAIHELNERFKEHSIGYQYVSGELIRIDSQYIHAEVVKPALSLLQAAGFRGPSDEFLSAHEHYRHGRYKEAIAGALKAFESTMKAICDARNWPYSASATAKPLIDVLLKNGLIPTYLESHFAGLRAAMESGLPTVRDKTSSAHGQGADPVTIPGHMAAYALHLAAADIVFLVDAHNALR